MDTHSSSSLPPREAFVICPFCHFEFSLSMNFLVVTCAQCLKRFVPEFKKEIHVVPSSPALKKANKVETIRIPEEIWGKYSAESEKPITALPIFEEDQEPKQGLILTPIQVSTFQTHFESEIHTLLSEKKSTDFIEKEELEGTSLIGHILFKVEKKIAEGGMGTIYRAKMVCADGFEKRVALKTLRPKYADDPKLLSMFISEARVMAELKHHNIAAIHSFGKYKGLYFYAMEYIEGRDLYAFQKRHQKLSRAAPIGILVYIIAQICNALSYIHSKRDNRGKPLELIHRDISPQNIMFSADGVVKVMDFGVAKGKSIASSQKKTLAGKLNYTAPEMALFREVDHRADIYSLGVVFYEMVTGRLPFQWNSPIEMNQQIENATFEPPSKYRKIPEDLEKIILKTMAKDPKQRWADAATLGFALNRFLYAKGLLFNEQTLANYLKGIFKNLAHVGVATSEQEDFIDLELARSSVEKQYVTKAQLMDCLRDQADYSSRGEHINLGALMVKKKLLTLQHFQELIQLQQIVIMYCSSCSNQYYVRASQMAVNNDCLRCASTLLLPTSLQTPTVDGHLLDL